MSKNNAPMSKVIRKFSIVLGGFILIGTMVFLYPKLSSKETVSQKEVVELEIEREVEARVAQNEAVNSEIEIQGNLTPVYKVDIFSEVTGTLVNQKQAIKEGEHFGKGDVLLKIDTKDVKLNILSQKSKLLNLVTALMPEIRVDFPDNFPRWKAYLDKFDVKKSIPTFPEPTSEQERLFIASKDLWNQYYTIQKEVNLLKKHTIYAPFSGVITQSNIQSGALVIAGQKMGELMGTDLFELKVTLPLSDLPFVKKGTKITLKTTALSTDWTGTVKRISSQIDTNTQSVIAYIEVKGKDLKEGMYLSGNLTTRTIENALRIPVDLLENQNKVFIIKNGKLTLQEVEVVNTNAIHAVVKGIADETLLLSKKITGAYEGLKVKTLEDVTVNIN